MQKRRLCFAVLCSFAIVSFSCFVFAADDWREFVGPAAEWTETVNEFPATFYVSLNGNDMWSGRLAEPNETGTDGPFRSFEKAKEAVRAYRASQSYDGTPTVVEVLPGLYELDKTLSFDTADSGTPSAPVVWRGTAAENGEPAVILRGGKTLGAPLAVTDPAILDRLKPEVRDKVVRFDLKAAGVSDFGQYETENDVAELFQNGKPMTIARYPNGEFKPMKNFDLEGNEEFVDHDLPAVRVPKIIVDGYDISSWQNEPDAWAFGYWCCDWANSREKIVKVDTEKGSIELAPPFHKYGYRTDQYYYVYHLLCELDEPGEFFVDAETASLYFYPPEPIQPGELMMTILPGNVEGKDLNCFVFSGFCLDGCRQTAVHLEGKRILVDGCLIKNIGGCGIDIKGEYSLAFGNHLYNIGSRGIRFEGGDRYSLTPSHSAAVNNDIHHYARVSRVYAPGVQFDGCGGLISHNRITDAPHNAILYGGNDVVIELNEIARVCQESNDAGAVYCGGSWTMRGNKIRNNYMHDVEGFRQKGAVGVYLDDLFSSADITGNFFVKVTAAAFVGGGRDNHVTNNIFVDCNPAVRIDERGLDWQKHVPVNWLNSEKESGTINGMPYKSDPWIKAYPEIGNVLKSEYPGAPEGTLFAGNIAIKTDYTGDSPVPFEGDDIYDRARPYIEVRDNFLGSSDFLEKLMKSSTPNIPGTEISFEPIPMDQIGLFNHSNALRKD